MGISWNRNDSVTVDANVIKSIIFLSFFFGIKHREFSSWTISFKGWTLNTKMKNKNTNNSSFFQISYNNSDVLCPYQSMSTNGDPGVLPFYSNGKEQNAIYLVGTYLQFKEEKEEKTKKQKWIHRLVLWNKWNFTFDKNRKKENFHFNIKSLASFLWMKFYIFNSENFRFRWDNFFEFHFPSLK